MITDKKIQEVQAKIKLAILEIEKSENVKIEFGAIRYNSAFYKTSMTVKTSEKTEKVKSVYENICRGLGFTQNVMGMSFDSDKGNYIITDIQTKNRKYPIIAQSKNGKSYKFSVDSIKNYLGGDKLINRNANLDKLC